MERFLTRSSSTSSLSSKRQREDSSDNWQVPKRTAIPNRVSGHPQVATNNRFNGLQVDPSPSNENFKLATSQRKNPGRIPPIIINLLPEWTHSSLREHIEKCTKKFHLQYRGNNKVLVQCYSIESHDSLKLHFKNENFFYHTFTRKDEKTYKTVIKGLPCEFEQSLPAELEFLGFKGAIVSKLNKQSQYKYPPLLVQLPATTDISKFRQIKYLCNCVVTIERYKKTQNYGTQCFRCQSFGHASRNCNLQPRCVKCTESHPTKDCPKKDNSTPAKCCNCQMDHPANYRQCPSRLKYVEELNSKRTTTMQQSYQRNYQPTYDGRSWAKVAASSNNIPHVDIPNNPEVIDSASKEMLSIFMAIKSIRHEFVNCETMIDKVLLILTKLYQYV